MGCCGFCPGPNTPWANQQNILMNLIPWQPPPPVIGVTYNPLPLRTVAPYFDPIPSAVLAGSVDRYWYSTLARSVYWPDGTMTNRVMGDLKPLSAPLTFVRSVGPTFGYALGEYDDGWVLVVSGTTNTSQAIAQFLSVAGNFTTGTGDWEANSYWYSNAQAIVAAIGGTIGRGDNVLAIGHSAGGAIANLVLALLPGVANVGQYQSVTFGAPAWSNTKLNIWMSSVQQVRYTNQLDAVPYLPPPAFVGYASGIGSPAFRINPGDYAHSVLAQVLQTDGSLSWANSFEQQPLNWLQNLASFISGMSATLAAHTMANYTALTFRQANLVGPWPFAANWANYPDLLTANAAMLAAGF
jgi:hypothetical protein